MLLLLAGLLVLTCKGGITGISTLPTAALCLLHLAWRAAHFCTKHCCTPTTFPGHKLLPPLRTHTNCAFRQTISAPTSRCTLQHHLHSVSVIACTLSAQCQHQLVTLHCTETVHTYQMNPCTHPPGTYIDTSMNLGPLTTSFSFAN